MSKQNRSGGRAFEGYSFRIQNRSGSLIGILDIEELGDYADTLYEGDRVEVYDDNNNWVETLNGRETVEAYYECRG